MTVWGCRSRACLEQFQLSQALEATPAAPRHGAGVAGLSTLLLAPAAAAVNGHASSTPLLRGTPAARETWRLKLPPGMQSAYIPIKHFPTPWQSALDVRWIQSPVSALMVVCMQTCCSLVVQAVCTSAWAQRRAVGHTAAQQQEALDAGRFYSTAYGPDLPSGCARRAPPRGCGCARC